jgi:tetratricopeptide (TPR) repeat protein
VTLALVQQSESARANGDYDKAIALLERAIRIESDRPELWIELATCHLEQGDYNAAEQFARKALLFTGTQYQLEQRAWGVIGAAQAARREDGQL